MPVTPRSRTPARLGAPMATSGALKIYVAAPALRQSPYLAWAAVDHGLPAYASAERTGRSCPRLGQPVGPFDDPGDLHAGVGSELGEDVADVGSLRSWG